MVTSFSLDADNYSKYLEDFVKPLDCFLRVESLLHQFHLVIQQVLFVCILKQSLDNGDGLLR
jgi:hypothetical protein